MGERQAKGTGADRARRPSRAAPPRTQTAPTLALRRAYEAFNNGDIESVLALMCEDVDWLDTLTGRRKRGHSAIRRQWRCSSRLFTIHLEPLDFLEDRAREQVVVEARQRVSGRNGKAIAHQMVRHAFKFRDGRIERMDMRELPL